MVSSLKNFINYWIFRYFLVTELYMVEKWERVMIHIVFFFIFSIISLFNAKVIVGFVSSLTDPIFNHSLLSLPNKIHVYGSAEL